MDEWIQKAYMKAFHKKSATKISYDESKQQSTLSDTYFDSYVQCINSKRTTWAVIHAISEFKLWPHIVSHSEVMPNLKV